MAWKYEYSEALKMKYAWQNINNEIEVMTEDKIIYKPSEIKLLDGIEINLAIHNVKKLFGGTIIGHTGKV